MCHIGRGGDRRQHSRHAATGQPPAQAAPWPAPQARSARPGHVPDAATDQPPCCRMAPRPHVPGVRPHRTLDRPAARDRRDGTAVRRGRPGGRHLRGLGPGHRLGSQPPRRPPAQVRLGRESLPRSTGASPMTRPSTSSSSSAASTRGGYARSARSSAGETSATTPRSAASSVLTRSSRFARRPLARPDRAAWCSKRLTNAGQRSVTADAGGGSGSGERTRCVPRSSRKYRCPGRPRGSGEAPPGPLRGNPM